jgi:hypothetical protein
MLGAAVADTHALVFHASGGKHLGNEPPRVRGS